MKISRSEDEAGKGGYWALNTKYQHMFRDGVFQKPRRGHKSRSASKSAAQYKPKHKKAPAKRSSSKAENERSNDGVQY